MSEPSSSICEQLQTLLCFQTAKSIGTYIATDKEIDLLPYLKNHLPLSFPRFKNPYYEYAQINTLSQLVPGKFGILEPDKGCPVTPHLDILLIPGVRFDKQGHRHGHGHGYYDRLLQHETGIKIGICYDYQIEPRALKKQPHDIPMDIVITPTHMRVIN